MAAGRIGWLIDNLRHPTGLIGFDVETGSRIVRPELRRLENGAKNTTANEQYAVAA